MDVNNSPAVMKSSAKVSKYISTKVSKYISTEVSKYISTEVSKYISTEVHNLLMYMVKSKSNSNAEGPPFRYIS